MIGQYGTTCNSRVRVLQYLIEIVLFYAVALALTNNAIIVLRKHFDLKYSCFTGKKQSNLISQTLKNIFKFAPFDLRQVCLLVPVGLLSTYLFKIYRIEGRGLLPLHTPAPAHSIPTILPSPSATGFRVPLNFFIQRKQRHHHLTWISLDLRYLRCVA